MSFKFLEDGWSDKRKIVMKRMKGYRQKFLRAERRRKL